MDGQREIRSVRGSGDMLGYLAARFRAAHDHGEAQVAQTAGRARASNPVRIRRAIS